MRSLLLILAIYAVPAVILYGPGSAVMSLPPETCRRLPLLLGCSPSPTSRTLALTIR